MKEKRLSDILKSTPYGQGTLGDFLHEEYIEEVIVPHLLENSVSVPLCNVGDKLYYICTVPGFHSVVECVVEAIQTHTNGREIYYASSSMSKERLFKEDFGRIVFTDEEEAHKALKDYEQNEERGNTQ